MDMDDEWPVALHKERHMGPAKGTACERRKENQALLDLLCRVWNGDYMANTFDEKPSAVEQLMERLRIAIILLAMEQRSYPELLHEFEKGRIKDPTAGRPMKEGKIRSKKPTSARFHMRCLPEEYSAIHWALGNPQNEGPCQDRFFSKTFAMMLVLDMGYLRDTEEDTFVDNSNNETLRRNMDKLARLCDERVFGIDPSNILSCSSLLSRMREEMIKTDVIRVPDGVDVAIPEADKACLPSEKDLKGYVYFKQNLRDDYVKVGKSEDPIDRQANFGVSTLGNVSCDVIGGGFFMERWIKMKLKAAHHCIYGEKFDFNPTMKLLKTLQTCSVYKRYVREGQQYEARVRKHLKSASKKAINK